MTTKFLLTLSIFAAATSVRAAETISYAELRTHTSFKDESGQWRFKLVTVDGKDHLGDRLSLNAEEAVLIRDGQIEKVRSDEIRKLEIRRRRALLIRRSAEAATIPIILGVTFCDGLESKPMAIRRAGCVAAISVATLPILVIGAFAQPQIAGVVLFNIAAAPVYLAIDGVRRLRPSKTYEIVR